MDGLLTERIGSMVRFFYLPFLLSFKQSSLYGIEIVRQPLMALFGIVPGPGLIALDEPCHVNRPECLCECVNALFPYLTDRFHWLTPP